MLEGMQHAPREHQGHEHPCLQLKLVPQPGLGGQGAGGGEPAAPPSRDPALGGAVHPRSWLRGASLVLRCCQLPPLACSGCQKEPSQPGPALPCRRTPFQGPSCPRSWGFCWGQPTVASRAPCRGPAQPYQCPARYESWPAGSGWCRSQGPSQDSECLLLWAHGSGLERVRALGQTLPKQTGPSGWEATAQEPTRCPGAVSIRRVGVGRAGGIPSWVLAAELHPPKRCVRV